MEELKIPFTICNDLTPAGTLYNWLILSISSDREVMNRKPLFVLSCSPVTYKCIVEGGGVGGGDTSFL